MIKIVNNSEVTIAYCPLINIFDRYRWFRSIKRKYRSRNRTFYRHKNSLISWSAASDDRYHSTSNLMLLKAQLLLKKHNADVSIFIEEINEIKNYFVFIDESIFFVKSSKDSITGNIRNMINEYKFLHSIDYYEVHNVKITVEEKYLYCDEVSFKINQDKFSIKNKFALWKYIRDYYTIILSISALYFILLPIPVKFIRYDEYAIRIAKEYISGSN